MDTHPTSIVQRAIEAALAALTDIEGLEPAALIPRLREAQHQLTIALDEAMAAALLDSPDATIRAVGNLAGLSENAVGPRLARTSTLGGYAQEGAPPRVTAPGVSRARYDQERDEHRPAPEKSPPLRFKPRRPS